MKLFKAIISLAFFSVVAIGTGFLMAAPCVAFFEPTPENYNTAVHATAWAIGGSTIAIGILGAVTDIQWLKKGSFAGEFTAGICERVQTSLNSILGGKSPEVQRTPVGYLQAITSPQNTAGVEMVPVDPGTGKKKKVRITYAQRGTEADVVDTQNDDCSTEIEKTPFEEEVEVTSYLRTKGIKFDDNEMRKLCEPDSQWMSRIVNGEIDALVRVLNKKLILQQSTNFGKFNPDISPSTKKTVQMLANSGESARYRGEVEILRDFQKLDVAGRPILIGDGNLDIYTQLQKVGCCNNFGVDLSQGGKFDYFYDRFLGDIIGGDDDFIGLAPGYVQLMTWNKYVGTYKKENGTFAHGTIMDPITGLTFDMKWHFNDCNDTWSLFFGLWYDLYFLPSDAYAAGDELRGVNYTLHYEATSDSGPSYE